MAQKRYLFTPGPTPVPPQVLAALGEPVLHHRAPDFREVYARVLGRLQEVHRTRTRCCSSPARARARSSRRSSASARRANGCWRSRRAPSASAGRRWRGPSAARSRSSATPGARRRPQRTCAQAAEIEPVSLVFLVHSETSTGVVADIQALAAAAKEAGALVVVDAVSSLGAVPLEMDEWGLDVVISGSQKALMTPPGLATAAVSAAALGAGRALDAAELLLRLGADAHGAGEARQRLHAGCVARSSRSTSRSGSCSSNGLDEAFERHIRLGRACRAGIKAMGLELFSPDEDRSAVVTAVADAGRDGLRPT